MHPALSVIVFTVASGAGYGLIALLGVLAPTGLLPDTAWFAAVAVGLALVLVSAGLLSSTAHLGRPERAWRAFSQWRSSWLSREGVAALATYPPALVFGGGWLLTGSAHGWVALCGVLAALGAIATVVSTAMIYASLKPIAQWRTGWTVAAYLVLSLMSGAALLQVFVSGTGRATGFAVFALAAIVVGWVVKRIVWRRNATVAPPTTLASAVGLDGGTVRSVEWPHTEENYLLKEMGHRIARKHALKLRRIAEVLAFAAPLVLIVAALAAGPGAWATAAAVLAAISMLVGLLVERWLFFAEAKHTVRLYYGV